MKLIDRDALIRAYDAAHVGPPGGARKLMEEAPVVAEVVHCRECRHREALQDGESWHCKEWDTEFYAPHYSMDRYFCADGEEKEPEPEQNPEREREQLCWKWERRRLYGTWERNGHDEYR